MLDFVIINQVLRLSNLRNILILAVLFSNKLTNERIMVMVTKLNTSTWLDYLEEYSLLKLSRKRVCSSGEALGCSSTHLEYCPQAPEPISSQL